MTGSWRWLAAGGAVLVLGLLALGLLRRRLRRMGRRAVRQFRARLDRYKLVARRHIQAELLADSAVLEAIAARARASGTSPEAVRRRVVRYIDEIVPFFNVLSYYRLGYNLSRLVLNLLYRSSIAYEDREALERIPREDVVVYVMNHRSNADYVVVAYVLARVVSISYAVGEWARVWPLEYVFKSFGSYFVRRRYREPLYHTVLERYVQLITRNGVTQGIFLEGGLTRDGALRPPKLGLLDYLLGSLRDPAFQRGLWFIPVGINYDRVLEDRVLIRERIVGGRLPGRARQLATVTAYLLTNLARLLTGRLRRYGRAAVTFGTPVSARDWVGRQPAGVLALPRAERLPWVQRLGELLMREIGAVVPVTPVPLAAAALLSFGSSAVSRSRLLERMDDLRDTLRSLNARLVRGDIPIADVWDRAWRMFHLRRLVVAEGETLLVLPEQRPLLEYYANGIRHLLPAEAVVAFSPAHEPDRTLPRLATREELDIGTPEPPARPAPTGPD